MAKRATASSAGTAETAATKPKAATKAAAKPKASPAKEAATKAEPAAKKDAAKKDAVKDAVSSKKAAPALLTLTDIGDHLASTFDMPKSHAKIYLSEAVALIGKSLRRGGKVRIAGLGVFEVKKRAARKGRNPSTGEPMKIKASKRVGFAVARDLKVKL